MSAVPSRYFIKKPLTLWDQVVVAAGVIGTAACIITGSWVLTVLFICATIVSYNSIKNDYVTVDVKPLNIGEKQLFKIKEWVDGEERETYVVAESFDEVNLFCQFEELKPGETSLVGKVHFFK